MALAVVNNTTKQEPSASGKRESEDSPSRRPMSAEKGGEESAVSPAGHAAPRSSSRMGSPVKGGGGDGNGDEVAGSELRELSAAKINVKKEIKQWLNDWEATHGQPPTTQDKQAIKHLYVQLRKVRL